MVPVSMTGGAGMLAGGCILPVCQRQHLQNPDIHTGEVVAAGTNLAVLTPTVGVLQNLRIQLGRPVVFYVDSASTAFVVRSDTSVRKSAWLIRRVEVLQEACAEGFLQAQHIGEGDMCADPFTKYLVVGVWARHMHYLLNKVGDLPSVGR